MFGSCESATWAHQSRLAAAARPHDCQQPAQRPNEGSSGAGSGAGTLLGRMHGRHPSLIQAEALRLAHDARLWSPGCMRLPAPGLPLPGIPHKHKRHSCVHSKQHARNALMLTAKDLRAAGEGKLPCQAWDTPRAARVTGMPGTTPASSRARDRAAPGCARGPRAHRPGRAQPSRPRRICLRPPFLSARAQSSWRHSSTTGSSPPSSSLGAAASCWRRERRTCRAPLTAAVPSSSGTCAPAKRACAYFGAPAWQSVIKFALGRRHGPG